MTDEAPPTDEELLSGFAAMLARRHSDGAPSIVAERIRQLDHEGDTIASALLRGVADELGRMGRSSATH